MSDEIERRLRESLRAYADLVDAPEGGALPVRTTTRTTPRNGLRGWRGAVLVAAAGAAVATGSVWLVTADHNETVASSAAGSAESGAADREGDSAAAAQDAAGSGDVLGAPASPEVGVAYAVDLYTHCGVLGIDVGGIWFAADPPLVESPAGPPAGWGDPDQPGTVTLLAADRAVFRDDAGHEVRLRADDAARPAPCG